MVAILKTLKLILILRFFYINSIESSALNKIIRIKNSKKNKILNANMKF